MVGEWTTQPLEDCMAAIIDYRGKSPEKTTFGVPLVTAKIIKGGRIERPEEFIAEKDFDGWMRRGMPVPGDIVITTEAPLGEVAQLDGRKVALAQRVITLRGKPDVLDNTFLKFLLQSNPVQEELRSRGTGTTVVGIRQSELRKVSLTLPPLPEQKTIAQILGALDDKIELNRRMNETLEALAQSLFKSWFVDATQSALPKGWRMATIVELVDINAWTLGKDDKLDRIEYVEISEVSHGNIGNIQVYQRGEEPSRARRRLRHGDTVVSTVRPDRGSYFLCLHPSPSLIASTGFAVLTPKKAPWSYIHAALTQPEFFEHLGQQADGGAYPAVRPEIIGNWEVPLPDKPAVFESFHRICAPLFERAEHNRRQSRTLTALRDALLPKLLSGELRVKDTYA
jgi:type I restriction enzyme S subunit